MRPLKTFLAALKIEPRKSEFERIAKAANVSLSLVKYWNANLIAPSEIQLQKICREYAINPMLVKLRMGLIDEGVRRSLMENADTFADATEPQIFPAPRKSVHRHVLKTDYGNLYQ